MVCWMATSAYGSINGVFCRPWFDWWHLLPVVWLSGGFCQNDWLMCLSREIMTSAKILIGGLYPQGMIASPSTETLYWVVSPLVVWLLGRIPVSGLIIGLILFSGWINDLFSLQVVWFWDHPLVVVQLMVVTPSASELIVCYLFGSLIMELLPPRWYD